MAFSGTTTQSLQVLDQALAKSSDSASLRSAAGKILELIPPPSPIGQQLSQALQASADSGELRKALESVREMLAFQPKYEAVLPKDFPTYTPVGLIEVKTYPQRRLAQAGQFWTLFRHISSNEIAMTTPVEMEFDSASGKPEQQNMAFYYADPAIGSAGRQGKVQVIDHEPLTVVALGHRGNWNRDRVSQAEQSLTAWVNQHPEYQITGPLRVMGYNSPMVSRSKKFFEVQLPIRKLNK